MLTCYKNLCVLQLVVALFTFPGRSSAVAPEVAPPDALTVAPQNEVPAQIENTARRLMDELDRQGYEVLRGYPKLYTAADCDSSYDESLRMPCP